MSGLCKFSNILGKPNEGIHKIRIFNIAVIDVILTFLIALILYYVINKYFSKNISFWVYFAILIVVGIILHRLFCVQTTIDKLLFGYNVTPKY